MGADGRACNQAPDSFAEAASRRALQFGSMEEASRIYWTKFALLKTCPKTPGMMHYPDRGKALENSAAIYLSHP